MGDCGLDKWIYLAGIAAMVAPLIVSALIGIFMLIPGQQPEKFLSEKVLPILNNVKDYIERHSRK